ncbi:TadE family type IV pilus minor pilin [Blastococcus sp. LR1]|uniref:TadE family type IV pilus minor pilin n=1 Tax=Blastococcus sp. LR1 TaxID=2877000 RepID=UPI001CCFB669|nr:TadE family type IV pilus minor pilin [Blastococcus sp. LR1]MCA0144739.1 pilus assembly protein [Blastococcus sp. LR1]
MRRREASVRRGEAGMVTAETAVVLPVLVLVLVAAVAVITVVGAQLRCVDAAGEGARAAARGEDVATVVEWAGRAAPAGARTDVSTTGGEVRVVVTAEIAPLGPLPWRFTVTAESVAQREPDGIG